MNIFDILFLQPFLNVMVAIYHLLIAAHIPYALGFSIIILTTIIKIFLYPLMHQSLKQQKKMQALTPQMNKLKEKYKGDAKRMQMEQMALFKAEGVNPASGCFILLLQLPVFIALYNVLLKVVSVKSANDINQFLYTDSLNLTKMWDTSFFGLPLGKTPAELLPVVGLGIFWVAVITGGLQLIQSKMMATPAADKPVLPKKTEPDFATTLQTQMLYMLPIFVGFFAHTLPFGLSLYWNTFTIFGIIQQYMVAGWGGLVDWLPFLGEKKSLESKYK